MGFLFFQFKNQTQNELCGEGGENQGCGGREGGWGGEENFQRRTGGKRSPTRGGGGGGGGGGVGTTDGGRRRRRRRRGSDLQQMGWLPTTILPFLTLFIAFSSDL